MGMKFQKFIGWALLFSGVAIIFWSLYSSYNIFNDKTPVPEIFKIEKKKAVNQKEVQGLEAQLEEKVKELMGEQFKTILPADSIPKLLNLISWSVLAGILIFGGSQLSGIGIKMFRGKE
jgi:hypothetical protein